MSYRVFETTFAGRKLTVEMGKMCVLSNGSCLVRYGETVVLANVTMSAAPREGIDFFPLSVDFEEKIYSVGRIPGSFLRREGRPGESAILSSRVVDRPMRPLFPKDMRNDVSIVMTVMSVDPDCDPQIVGMLGAIIATCASDVPFNGPIGGISVGLVDGEIVLMPNAEQQKKNKLDLTLVCSKEKVVMIEAGAQEVPEDTMLQAIKTGHEEIKKFIDFVDEIIAKWASLSTTSSISKLTTICLSQSRILPLTRLRLPLTQMIRLKETIAYSLSTKRFTQNLTSFTQSRQL